jgi:16S rRNA (uracil1498-N3)-methyltransferase
MDAFSSHHLLRVTGIAPGEAVEIFDGAGQAAIAVLDRVEGGRAVLQVRELLAAPDAPHSVWLLPALLRPAAMETVIRMSTELGVLRVTPILSERVVARGDKSDRWRRIAQAAAAQCGRADLPQIDVPCTLDEGLDAVGEGWTAVVCVPGASGRAPEGPAALFIGPEGGWSEAELALVQSSGVDRLGLGATTLRADTAAVAGVVRVLSRP